MTLTLTLTLTAAFTASMDVLANKQLNYWNALGRAASHFGRVGNSNNVPLIMLYIILCVIIGSKVVRSYYMLLSPVQWPTSEAKNTTNGNIHGII